MIANIGTSILLPMLIYDASNALMGERIFWIALLMGGLGLISSSSWSAPRSCASTPMSRPAKRSPSSTSSRPCSTSRNRAALGATLSGMSMFIGMYGASGRHPGSVPGVLQECSNTSGLVAMASYVGMFAFLPFIKPLVSKVGKKEMCTIGAAINVVRTS